MIIIADTREQKPWSFMDHDVERKSLKEGDYTTKELLKLEKTTGRKTVRIERKASTSELAGNLGTNLVRFEKEMDKLLDYEEKYIICEFSMMDVLQFPKNSGIPRHQMYKKNKAGKFIYKIKMTPDMLLSKIEYITNIYEIEFIYAGDRANAMVIAQEILENAHKEKIKG